MKDMYRSGVGLMMVNSEGRVFVGKRCDALSAWQMPQGGIDESEKPKDALFREAKEEIGTSNFEIIAESSTWYTYDFPSDLKSRIFGGQYYGQRQKWFFAKFLGKENEINIHTAIPEFCDWRWVAPLALKALTIDFKKKLCDRVVSEFRPFF